MILQTSEKSQSTKAVFGVDLKAALISSLFTLAFAVWESTVFGTGFINYFIRSISDFNLTYAIFINSLMLVSLLLLNLYVYIAIKSGGVVKAFLVVVFMVAVSFEYGYWNAFGRFSVPIDMEIAFFQTNFEQKLGAVSGYFHFLALLPSLVFATIAFYYRQSFAKWRKHVGIFSMFFILVFYLSVGAFFKARFLRNDIPLLSFGNFFKTATRMNPKWLNSYKRERERLARAPQVIERPKKNIIFITDESLRSDHLSLYGYERNTTPYLEEIYKNGLLKKFDAVSGSTCSTASAELLLTGVRISDLPDDEKTKRYPTLFQYAKRMGYKTRFWDGQMSVFWNGTYKDKEFVDDWRNAGSFGQPTRDIDFSILRNLGKTVRSSAGNFIWIWKRGFHYPYTDGYPNELAVWKPVPKSRRLENLTSEERVNSYDNAIKYNLDRFFRNLVKIVRNNPNTIVIYTADHGQNLGEAKYLATHCRTSKNEARVPILLLGEIDSQPSENFKATHENLFGTILDLMEVPKPLRKHKYEDSLLNPNAKSRPIRYYWGLDLREGKKLQFD